MKHLLLAASFGSLLASGCARSDVEALPLGSDSTSCGSCHESHYDEWSSSPHGTSHASPVFVAMLPGVEAAWGIEARETCVGCHAPEHSPEPSIGCVSCHAATGNHAERDGNLAIDLTSPLAGALTDARPTPAHRTRRSAFLASPSLCGTCHEITGPGLVDEPTLTEYRASPAAAEGQTCASCHLPEADPRVLANTSDLVRTTSSHRFVGFDPIWGATPSDAADAAERTRALLASALELELELVEEGVNVIVRNVGAGHSVPTGATFLRDIWVDVVADGVLHERVITLGDQPRAGETNVALLTDADHVHAGSLPPGESFCVMVPVETGEVSATLRGRAIRQSVLEALFLEARGDEVPVHEVHRAVLYK